MLKSIRFKHKYYNVIMQFFLCRLLTMDENLEENSKLEKKSRLAQEYEVLHEVAKALHHSDGMRPMLNSVLEILTQFEELRVEKKAGIFLSDPEKKVLRLYTTVGEFSDEFMQKEQEVPFGDCLCGRVALSGKLMMSLEPRSSTGCSASSVQTFRESERKTQSEPTGR